MFTPLPEAVAAGATVEGNEYGWTVATFRAALTAAEQLGLACLGGQFQFRTEGGIYEAYWLSADSSDRVQGEPWPSFARRSCAEVGREFMALVEKTDFAAVAAGWTGLREAAVDIVSTLVFVAYFVTEEEFLSLRTSETAGSSLRVE
jgi:hypothetical protein